MERAALYRHLVVPICTIVRPNQTGDTTPGRKNMKRHTRRQLLQGGAALGLAGAFPMPAIAQAKPVKVGLMLPYSGTFAQLGENITHSIEMYLAEKGGKLGGREIQLVKLDDESKPELGLQNADRLIKRDNVDVL